MENDKAIAIGCMRDKLDLTVSRDKLELRRVIKQYSYECWLREMDLPRDVLNLALTGDADIFLPGETWEYTLRHIPFEDRYFARLILGYEAPSRWVTCLAKKIERYVWFVKE